MRPVVGIIFDMDGVLVDSADAHRRAWQQLGGEIGIPFTAELFGRTFGQRNATIIPTWLSKSREAVLSPERIEALAERKEVLYRELVREGAIRIYPGATELLTRLHGRGARVAIASSGPHANLTLLIETLAVRDAVDAVVGSEDVREGKPHPEVFLTAAVRLAVAPAQCAVVEDSVHGIEAANRAGMLAVAVLTSTPRAALEHAGADLIVDEISALQAWALMEVVATNAAGQRRYMPGSRSSRTGANERR